MRRYALASLLLAAGCGRLVEDQFEFQYLDIESPVDGAKVLGRDVFPVEVSVECPDTWLIEVRFDGVAAGEWTPDIEQAQGCSGSPGTYCVPTSGSVPLGLGAFWPGRMAATMYCANLAGEFASAVHRVYVSPFEGLAMAPGSARSLLAAPGGGVIAVSSEGLHLVAAGGEVSGMDNRSRAGRAFGVGDDLYYHAPCDGLACDAGAPDLFRVDAATLTPRGDKARLGCAPLSVEALGDQRVMALGGCDPARVRWSAADLSSPTEETVDVRLTDRAARRGDEVVLLAWRDDELVILAAGATSPVATRPTGVRGALAALTDDGARAAVLDAAGRLVQIDTATGAPVASVALPPRPPGEVLAFAYAPGTQRVVIALADVVWIVDGDEPRRVEPLVEEDTELTVRVVAPVDGTRILGIADQPGSFPPRSLVYVTDGATTALRVWVGGDWTLTAPPLLAADGTLHLAFDTLQGPVVVSHHVATP